MLKSLHDRSNITFKKILQKYLLEKKAWLAVPICTHSTLMHSSPNTFFALSSKRADRKNHSHSSTLAFPITSPYGDTICKRHLDKFKCDFFNSSRARNSQGIVKSTTEARAKKNRSKNSKNIPNSSQNLQ